jgi:hypothetical protein
MKILVETDMKAEERTIYRVGEKEKKKKKKKRPTTFYFSFLNCKRKCKERSPHGLLWKV